MIINAFLIRNPESKLKIGKLAKKLALQLFFGEILTIFIEAFIEVTIAGTMNIMQPDYDTIIEKASLISSWWLLAVS